jgi:hypothetical protein
VAVACSSESAVPTPAQRPAQVTMNPCSSSEGLSCSTRPQNSATIMSPSATSGSVFIQWEMGRRDQSAWPY